jgi:hypothetical protein
MAAVVPGGQKRRARAAVAHESEIQEGEVHSMPVRTQYEPASSVRSCTRRLSHAEGRPLLVEMDGHLRRGIGSTSTNDGQPTSVDHPPQKTPCSELVRIVM